MISGDVTRFSTASTTPSGVQMPIAVEPNWFDFKEDIKGVLIEKKQNFLL